MQIGEYASARDYAIQALGANPNNPSLLSARGRAELALGNIQMATELAHLVLQKDPNNTDARDVLVEAALTSDNEDLLREARTLIESAINKNPADEKLLISWAHVMTSLKLRGCNSRTGGLLQNKSGKQKCFSHPDTCRSLSSYR